VVQAVPPASAAVLHVRREEGLAARGRIAVAVTVEVVAGEDAGAGLALGRPGVGTTAAHVTAGPAVLEVAGGVHADPVAILEQTLALALSREAEAIRRAGRAAAAAVVRVGVGVDAGAVAELLAVVADARALHAALPLDAARPAIAAVPLVVHRVDAATVAAEHSLGAGEDALAVLADVRRRALSPALPAVLVRGGDALAQALEGAGSADTGPLLADLVLAAGPAAAPAVRRVAVDVDAGTVAVPEALGADAGRVDAGLTGSAGLAARTAVLVGVLQIDALAVALGRPAGALELALALHADAFLTLHPALAAVVGIAHEVDALTVALRPPGVTRVRRRRRTGGLACAADQRSEQDEKHCLAHPTPPKHGTRSEERREGKDGR